MEDRYKKLLIGLAVSVLFLCVLYCVWKLDLIDRVMNDGFETPGSCTNCNKEGFNSKGLPITGSMYESFDSKGLPITGSMYESFDSKGLPITGSMYESFDSKGLPITGSMYEGLTMESPNFDALDTEFDGVENPTFGMSNDGNYNFDNRQSGYSYTPALDNAASGYNDWESVMKASALDSSVTENHKEWVKDLTKTSSGASSRSVLEPVDVVPWVGLRRPDYYNVTENDTNNQVSGFDFVEGNLPKKNTSFVL